MKTYLFIEKNGSAVITVSEETEIDAWNYLAEIVKDLDAWRLEENLDEDDF